MTAASFHTVRPVDSFSLCNDETRTEARVSGSAVGDTKRRPKTSRTLRVIRDCVTISKLKHALAAVDLEGLAILQRVACAAANADVRGGVELEPGATVVGFKVAD